MKKITVALMRDLEKQVLQGDISYSRMIEILNETIFHSTDKETPTEEIKLPLLKKGDKIKLYGKKTTVEGFGANYNDGIGDYEIILYTTGRGDPFKRSLDVIEIRKA